MIKSAAVQVERRWERTNGLLYVVEQYQSVSCVRKMNATNWFVGYRVHICEHKVGRLTWGSLHGTLITYMRLGTS